VLQQLAAKLIEIAEKMERDLGTKGKRNAAALAFW
jgi:hypothetical protein